MEAHQITVRYSDGTQKTMVSGILICSLLALLSFRLLAAKPKTAVAAAG